MKLLAAVSAVGFATVTVTGPGGCAGVVTEICVELTNVATMGVVEPNCTVAPLWKFTPLIVTTVPPLVLPASGTKLEIESATPVLTIRLTVPPLIDITPDCPVPIAVPVTAGYVPALAMEPLACSTRV